MGSFDLTAAFDTVQTSTLLDMLVAMDMDPGVVSWMKSYLSNGKQQVVWNGSLSDLLDIQGCCRQGSLLAPLLFLLVSAPLTNVLDDPVAYADDNSGASTNPAIFQLRSQEFEKTAAAAGLSINRAKTQFMLLGRSDRGVSTITVDGNRVNNSMSVSFLGMVLDTNLAPTPYIDLLISECKKRLNMIRLIESRMAPEQLETVVQGLLVGKAQVLLGQCFQVRVSAQDPVCGRAKRLQVVLNNAARLISGVKRCDRLPLTELWDRVHIPTVNRIVSREAGLAAWSALSPHSPGSPIKDLFMELSPDTRTRGASKGCLRPPGKRTLLLFNAVTIWNRFQRLREAKNIHSARTVIKKDIWPLIPL